MSTPTLLQTCSKCGHAEADHSFGYCRANVGALECKCNRFTEHTGIEVVTRTCSQCNCSESEPRPRRWTDTCTDLGCECHEGSE